MTAPEGPDPLAGLRAGLTALRRRSERRAAEIGPALLAAVLASPRRSLPVQHRTQEWLQIAEHVLVAAIRDDVERALPGVQVRDVRLVVERSDLTSVTLEVSVALGLPLADTADAVRAAALASLAARLGTGPSDAPVEVAVVDVHPRSAPDA